MFPTLLFLLLLPVTYSIIVRDIGCGETVIKINSSVIDWNMPMPVNMFYGAKVIVKGTDLNTGQIIFFGSVNPMNQLFVLVGFWDHTSYGVAPYAQWDFIDNSYPSITPSTGPFTLEFTILMNNSVHITNGAHFLYNFPLQMGEIADTIAGAIGFTGNFPATSVEYICNCRAPNANGIGIERCLGLN